MLADTYQERTGDQSILKMSITSLMAFSNHEGWNLGWGAWTQGAHLPKTGLLGMLTLWQHLKTLTAQTSMGWKDPKLSFP